MSLPRGQFIARHHGDGRRAAYDVPPGPLEWLVDLTLDAGLCVTESTMGGRLFRPLDWGDIADWITGAEESDLPVKFRRDMLWLSARFCAERNQADRMESEAPFDPGRGDLPPI